MKHPLPSDFAEKALSVVVAGAGGSGSQVLSGLARMHLALNALGHHGFHVTVFDPDTVTDANVGRQLFSPSDVGSYKAEVLVNRLNLYYGLDWRAYASKLERDTINEDDGGPEFLIGCVDSAAARRELAQCPFHYWLDLGNQEKKGQVILGNQFESSYRRRANDAVEQLDGDLQDEQPVTDKLAPEVRRQRKTLLETEFKRVMADRLPNVMEIFPELMDTKRKEDDAPSCSLAEALGRQDLFINQSIATFALQLLWQFIRQGGTNIQGYFINLETGQTRPLPVGAPFTKPDTKLGRAVKRCVKGWTATAKKKRTTKRK